MAYSAPPARTEISDTYPNPSNAVARVGFGKLWDYVTGLLGSTGSPPAARTALGLVIGTDVQAYSGTLASYATVSTLGFKNRIINGAMMIDQRNSGASVTPTSSTYTLDRWLAGISQSSKFSVQRNAGAVTPPAGFTNYLGVTSLSAYSITSSDYFGLLQRIEGFNIADLGWGTANAQTVTLSFWVRSSLTGMFGGALRNSADNRSYPFSYTISAANTWEQKTITVAGDTTGTWLTDNGVGIQIIFGLGYGSTYSGTAGSWSSNNYSSATGATSVVGTNGATFYITGVQLEKGSTATSFDYRPYGTELILCQRYCYVIRGNATQPTSFGAGYWNDSTHPVVPLAPKVTMRTIPSLIYSAVGDVTALVAAVSWNVASALTLTSEAGPDFAPVQATSTGGTTAAASQMRVAASATAYIGLTAEL